MKYIHIILLGLLSLTACKKEQQNIIPEQSSGVSELDPDTNFPFSTVSGQVDGYFSLNDFTTLASQNNYNRRAQFQGNLNKDGKSICIGIDNSPAFDKDGNWQTLLDQKDCKSFSVNKDLFDVSGANVVFTSNEKTFSEIFRVKAYMPARIMVTSHKYKQGLNFHLEETMTWTTDTQNPTYDVIKINYDPGEYGNEDFAKQGYNTPVVKIYQVHKSLGSYTFKSSDFEGIPHGAYFDIEIMRYNSAVHRTQDHKVYEFSLGSKVSHMYIMNRISF